MVFDLKYRAGLFIGSNLLSEQAARDRAEQGAMTNAISLNSVLMHITTLSSCICLLLYISGFQIYGMQSRDFYIIREQLSGEYLKKK